MTALTWDKVGEHHFQAGIDHGVLYKHDGSVIVWNGLIALEENSAGESASYFLDGVKYLEKLAPGDFQANLHAFTYPEEFDELNGIAHVAPGLAYYDQPPKSFNLSYRTKLGNDLDGTDHGYKIHLLYNVIASPLVYGFDSFSDPLRVVDFGWALSGVPSAARGYRPTVHISIDSTTMDPATLQIIEELLYGTETTNPRLPSIDEIRDLFETYGALVIIDNGDGTWTALDTANEYITMTDPTTFRIANADATYLDASTYTISTTTPE